MLMSGFILCNGLLACQEAPSVPESPDAGAAELTPAPAATTALGFCPTSIDVFGYSNVLFSGCGGAGVPTTSLPAGLFSPGTSGYDKTLAGRLQARISADPQLVAKFGTQWKIRSCSQGGGVMSTFASTKLDSQETAIGTNVTMCTSSPAPLLLYSANNVFDRFHGGGQGTTPDNQTTYAAHWAGYFQQFLDQRKPKAVLVSPQHEWHGEQGGSLSLPETCTWTRPTWNRAGLNRWRADHPTATNVTGVGDQQDVFRSHHPCCSRLGVACQSDWFSRTAGGDGWVHFGCAGADALETWWFNTLKSYLMNNQFTCP